MGIGVNVGKQKFPSEISDIATSIGNEIEIDSEEMRVKLIRDIAEELMRLLKETDIHEALSEYVSRNVLLNREVNVFKIMEGNGLVPEFTGIVTGIDEDFKLLVKKENGECVVLDSGEVIVRRN